MANEIYIHIIKDGLKQKYVVQAMAINKGEERILIPSQFGTETIVYETLEEAKQAIEQIGAGYKIYHSSSSINKRPSSNKIDYEKIADVFIDNLGNENLDIRNSAINALAKFGVSISDKLINILSTSNKWLVQQSVIQCIEKIIISDRDSAPVFIHSIIEISASSNTMVKRAALKTLEKICDLMAE